MSCIILLIVNSGTCLSVLSGQLNLNTGRPYSLFFFLFVTHHCNTYMGVGVAAGVTIFIASIKILNRSDVIRSKCLYQSGNCSGK